MSLLASQNLIFTSQDFNFLLETSHFFFQIQFPMACEPILCATIIFFSSKSLKCLHQEYPPIRLILYPNLVTNFLFDNNWFRRICQQNNYIPFSYLSTVLRITSFRYLHQKLSSKYWSLPSLWWEISPKSCYEI